MAIWSEGALERIGQADHIQIVTQRPDDSARKPVTIWVVRVGDDLYIRAVRGRFGGWFRATQERPDGRILVGDTAYDVIFEPADPALREAIDAAYQRKYGSKPPTHFAPIVARSAQEATLRLVPDARP